MEVLNVLFAFFGLIAASFAMTLGGGIYSLLEAAPAVPSRTYVRIQRPVFVAPRKAVETMPSERCEENARMRARFNPFTNAESLALDFWPEVVEEEEESVWLVANVKEEVVGHDGSIIDATDYPDPKCSADMWPLDHALEQVELPGTPVLGEGVRFSDRIIEILECEEDVTAAPEPPVYQEVERKFRLWQARQATEEVMDLLRELPGPGELDDMPF